MRRLLNLLLGLLLLLAVAAGGLLWRLDQGPISLAPLQPFLQPLIDRGSPFLVSYRDPTLVWLREERAVALAVRDVETRTHTGEFVAGAPLARVVVAVPPLLERRIEPKVIELELPELELTRQPDGSLVLSFAGQLTSLPLGRSAGPDALESLLGGRADSADPRFDELRLVRITAPNLVYIDATTGRTATASQARFELRRAGDGWTGGLALRLDSGRVRIAFSPGTGGGDDRVSIEADRFPLQGLLALLPQLPPLDLTLPVSGTIAFTLDRERLIPGPATIALTSADASLASEALGMAAIPIERARLDATLEAGWARAELSHVEIMAEGWGITAAGMVARGAAGLRAELELEAHDLDIHELLALWPDRFAGGAKQWAARHVTAGRASAATLHWGDRRPRPDQLDLGGSFDFSGVELRYLDSFPPAVGLAGAAKFAGDTLSVDLREGRTGEVALASGEVVLTNLVGEGAAHLEAQLQATSTVAAAISLLRSEPIEIDRATGLSPERASGQQSTRLELSLPLDERIRPERVRYTATTQLTGLELRDARPGYSLSAQRVSLRADPSGIDARGDVVVNGVPAAVTWREHLARPRGVQREVELTGRLDQAGARSLQLDWPEQITGAVGVTVKLVEAQRPLRSADVRLELREAELSVPDLLITKPPGQPGTVTARFVQPTAEQASIEELRVEAGSLRATGMVGLRLSPLRPERLSFSTVRLPLGDLSTDLLWERNAWRGRVDIGQLDLRPMRLAESSGGRRPTSIPDLAVEFSARSLRLGDAPLRELAGSVERRGGIWYQARVRGAIEDSQVALDLATRQRSAVTLRASDAGWFIRALAADDKGVRGGQLRLSADLLQTSRGIMGAGELKIRDFTLWGAPLVARVVSLASFSGLANALSGRGVPVRRLVVPFELQEDRLRLQDARLVAADIGARAQGTIDLRSGTIAVDGTVAPAYTINRILGRIPILGQILSGSGSDAALAATFSISNTLDDPQVTVNPLSVLVPGMIRDLFSALTTDEDSSDLR